jgi:surfactin synthase thioesterase subunit
LWPTSLPDDVDVIAVQFPGRDPSNPEPPVDSIAGIVDEVLRSIIELQRDEPMSFSLFGHSMGALVAFELTVALEAADGPRPERLFVSGRRPPDELQQREPVHALPDESFLDALQTSYGGVPDVVRNEPEVLALFLPLLRADIRALETYVPLSGRRVCCPVRVYGGSHDRNPRPSQLGGWQRVAEREVSIRVFEGDHFYLTATRDALAADIASHG